MADDDSDSEERPTNEELKTVIRRLIPKVNLQKTGVKAFVKLLQKECGGLDLKHRSTFIKDELSAAINEMESSDDDDNDNDSDSDESDTAQDKKKKAATKKKPSGRGKGLSIKKEISEDLAKFLGRGNEMARTEIVKAMWEYIKEHDLQNPENKREIILDKKLKAVFGVDRFTMFTMNKYIAAHIHPYKPVDLTPKPKPDKSTTPTKKRKRKEKDPPLKKKRKAKKPGLQPPYRLSDDLQAIVGTDVLPRPQVVTALWAYIKKKDLQVSILFL
jgi:upstream activation factor subunit UAF30